MMRTIAIAGLLAVGFVSVFAGCSGSSRDAGRPASAQSGSTAPMASDTLKNCAAVASYVRTLPGDLINFRVGEVILSSGPDTKGYDVAVGWSVRNGLFIAKLPIALVRAEPGAVSLRGVNVETKSAIYFDHANGTFAPGIDSLTIRGGSSNFRPGTIGVKELGVYDIEVTLDGTVLGTLRLAFCRNVIQY